MSESRAALNEARAWLGQPHADPGTVATAQVWATIAVAEALDGAQINDEALQQFNAFLTEYFEEHESADPTTVQAMREGAASFVTWWNRAR